jgi:hypothetical protein
MKFHQLTVLLSAALYTSVGQAIDRLTVPTSEISSTKEGATDTSMTQLPPNFVLRFPQFAVTNAPAETPVKSAPNEKISPVDAEGGSAEPECGALEFDADDYDLTWHIISVFLVAGVSLLGSGIPFLASRTRYLHMPMVMHLLNAFGVGVIFAAAMIHMLPPANEALNNPCLGLSYEGLAQVIAMGTILLIQCLETELVAQLSSSNRRAELAGPNPVNLLSSTKNTPLLEAAGNLYVPFSMISVTNYLM